MRTNWIAICLAVLVGGAVLAQRPATNYDETKVPAYRLPELLEMKAGRRVASPADWAARRKEIVGLLETQMFGRAPAKPAGMTFKVEATDRAALGGKALRKEVAIRVRGKVLNLLVYLPADHRGPVPVFVGLRFHPNQAVAADPGVRLRGAWVQDKETKAISLVPPDESTRGAAAPRWQLEKILSRGFGLATVYYGDIEPDFVGGMKLGIRGAYLEPGQEAPAPDEWGAIGAWAWGLSRIVDYLETDKDVDARRLAVFGHSRLGKTALWAGAVDARFAMVISNESGEGGAAISRRIYGETVADLNANFPHWFCGNYKAWSGREAQMPFDSHMVLALAAPRPLYVASAVEDRWADPKGEFLGAAAAGEVYALLSKPGLGTTTMPAVNQPVGDVVRYHVRDGKHDVTAYDWEQYLDFAGRHFRAGRP